MFGSQCSNRQEAKYKERSNQEKIVFVESGTDESSTKFFYDITLT